MSSRSDIAVIIPTWDLERALSLALSLVKLEARQRAEYVIVYPKELEDPHSAAEDNTLALAHSFFDAPMVRTIATPEYLSPVEAMAEAGRMLLADKGNSVSQLMLFIHDDAAITERGWDRTIAAHFAAHPRCGLAGFGGGIAFAHPDIYKLPYEHTQLARYDFISNMREAEAHGRRVTEPTQVAALDGFSLIITRELYERAGYVLRGADPADGPHVRGLWDACLRDGIQFHMYDAWVSCRAAELGYETWMIPIACHHEGGQTSVQQSARYAEVVARLGYASPEELYFAGHRRVYERFRRLLPLRVLVSSYQQGDSEQ